MVKEKIKPVAKKKEILETPKELILFNDEINTFDYVIQTLIDVCDHDFVQAEQCTMIAHYRGKCVIKNGTYAVLKPLKHEMIFRKLTVEIK